MEKYYYFKDNNGGCYVQDEVYSFADYMDLEEWAEENGYEIEEIETPEGYDFEEQKLVW